jgi:hypothetical protein
MARRVAESAAALVALRNVMQRVQQACDHAHRPASQVSSKYIPFVFLFFFFTLLEPRLLDFTQSLLSLFFVCLFNIILTTSLQAESAKPWDCFAFIFNKTNGNFASECR